METVYIYGLYDPRTNELKYIGKTNNLEKRLYEHIKEAENGYKSYKNDWIRSLRKRGLSPFISTLEEVSEEQWQECERKWINNCRKEGIKLTNLTDGGEGVHGYQYTEEQRKAISERSPWRGKVGWMKGKKLSSEHVEIIRQVNRGNKYNVGRKVSSETKQKMSEAHKGNKRALGYRHTEETKKKLAEIAKGKIPTLETRQKISNFHKGKQVSEETKEKLRQANLGKKASFETRLKISESRKNISSETRQKLSNASKGNKRALGLKFSEESKRKISEASKRSWAKRKGLLSEG